MHFTSIPSTRKMHSGGGAIETHFQASAVGHSNGPCVFMTRESLFAHTECASVTQCMQYTVFPVIHYSRPLRVPQRTARAHRAHRAHRALRQTRHLPVKCTPFSDRCFVKCYSKMFGSHCNVWFPMLCFQAVSKCLVSTAMFVSQCFVLKRSQNVGGGDGEPSEAGDSARSMGKVSRSTGQSL